jgi:myo-inositol-1(or 4)-monophosphatase
MSPKPNPQPLTSEYLHRALAVVQAAVKEPEEELRAHFGKVEHETKGFPGDFVTHLDREVETLLAKRLLAFDPTIGFRGEEHGVHTHADRTWLVDPIDGTTHFIRGLPFCTTMVALIDDGQVMLSVIYDFIRQDMYWAIRGEGAYCNDQPIHVSQRPLNEALLAFETNKSHPGNAELLAAIDNAAYAHFQSVCAGFDMIMVAAGKLEGRLAKDGYGADWDFAAGSLLVSEAGGIVANIGKTTYDYRNHDYLMTNPIVYKELTEGPDALFPL